MGLLLVIISYFIVALVMFILGPILFWFATKKFGKFEQNSIKKHALFWGVWFFMNAIIRLFQSLLLGKLPQVNEFLNTSFLLAMALHIGLCMLIFKVQLIPALKAFVAYITLFIVSFVIVAFLAIQFSFHEIILGASK